MYSPAIEFVIFTIFHVFSRYRSIAGKHIKNRPHTLQCFAVFLLNVFGGFSRLAVTQSTHIPREPQCLSPCPNWDSPPPLPQANVRADDWRNSLALCLPCGLHKIREKYIKGNKNCPRLSMYITGIEKKSNMCPPGIEFFTPEAT